MRFDDKAREWVNRMATRVSAADLEKLSRSMLASIDQVSSSRWEAAVSRAAALPGDVRPEKVKALTDAFARELGAFGAGVGAAAAAPVVGTAATMMAAAAELAWFTGRAGDLVLTVAALHGRPAPTVDERRAWVLAVLIYGGSARDGFARTVHEASTGLVAAPSTRLPLSTLQTVNRLLTPRLVRRYGARRGAIALGTALPVGIGALVGGSANYVAVRSLARHADAFFARMPYSAIDTTAIDVGGMLPGGSVDPE
ncbi:MAG: hypothetical protein Q7V88_03400 [Actinomycetota bacterium]|nr:hypothetical protein [Actinomycetota bacterium]